MSVAEVGLEDECRERVVDLSTCQNVMYEARNSVPGVKFEEGGRDGWVKVMRKRRKKVTGVEDLGSSSESELDVRAASRVEYKVDTYDGASGLCIQTGLSFQSVYTTLMPHHKRLPYTPPYLLPSHPVHFH